MDLLNFGKMFTRLFHLYVHTSASMYSQVRKLKKKKETQNHEVYRVYREISDSSLQQPDMGFIQKKKNCSTCSSLVIQIERSFVLYFIGCFVTCNEVTNSKRPFGDWTYVNDLINSASSWLFNNKWPNNV